MLSLMSADDNGLTPIEMILGCKAGHVFQLLQTPPLPPEMIEKLKTVIPEFCQRMTDRWKELEMESLASRKDNGNARMCSEVPSIYSTLKAAAMSGDWTQVPPVLLTARNMTLSDPEYGRTITHNAASARRLHNVPPHLLTLETMLAQDKSEQMPYTICREMEVRELSLDTIPDQLRASLLDYLKNQDPRPLIDRFQTCIYAYDWSHLPEELCTPGNALLTTPNGLNALLLAAYQENLELVPKQMVTEEALTAVHEFEGGDGSRCTTTALQVALYEQYDCIPPSVLSRHWDEIDPVIQNIILDHYRPLLRSDGSPSRPDPES